MTVLCRSRVRGRRAAVKSAKGKATSNEGELVDRPDVRLVDDGGLTIAVDQVSRRSRSQAPCAHPRSLARECLAFLATQACNRLALIVALACNCPALIVPHRRSCYQAACIHPRSSWCVHRCSSLLIVSRERLAFIAAHACNSLALVVALACNSPVHSSSLIIAQFASVLPSSTLKLGWRTSFAFLAAHRCSSLLKCLQQPCTHRSSSLLTLAASARHPRC